MNVHSTITRYLCNIRHHTVSNSRRTKVGFIACPVACAFIFVVHYFNTRSLGSAIANH